MWICALGFGIVNYLQNNLFHFVLPSKCLKKLGIKILAQKIHLEMKNGFPDK